MGRRGRAGRRGRNTDRGDLCAGVGARGVRCGSAVTQDELACSVWARSKPRANSNPRSCKLRGGEAEAHSEKAPRLRKPARSAGNPAPVKNRKDGRRSETKVRKVFAGAPRQPIPKGRAPRAPRSRASLETRPACRRPERTETNPRGRPNKARRASRASGPQFPRAAGAGSRRTARAAALGSRTAGTTRTARATLLQVPDRRCGRPTLGKMLFRAAPGRARLSRPGRL